MSAYKFKSWTIAKTENEEFLWIGQSEINKDCLFDVMEVSEHERQNKILKDAIQKLLNGINFALDEQITRRAISSRLLECRSEAIKVLLQKQN